MYVLYCFLFFFFKQKTAYEMRISDWSSDVCSSDLRKRSKPRRAFSERWRSVVRPTCSECTCDSALFLISPLSVRGKAVHRWDDCVCHCREDRPAAALLGACDLLRGDEPHHRRHPIEGNLPLHGDAGRGRGVARA